MHAYDQVLHALLIVSHPFWATFHVLPLGIFSIGHDVVNRPDPGHIAHISGVHQQLFLILEMESQPDFIVLPLFTIHSIHMSWARWESGLPMMDQVKSI